MFSAFEVAVGKGQLGTVGDCWDRWIVRTVECRESAKIVRQCLEKLDGEPVGEILGEMPRKMRPTGEVYVRVESARGDLGCYVVGNGKDECYRARFRTGSFNSLAVIEDKSEGIYIADLVALIASLDIVAPEIDR